MTQSIKVDEHLPGTQKAYEAGKMKYYVYFPPGNPPKGGWPILLFTHGIGEAKYTWIPKKGKKDEKEWKENDLKAIRLHGSPPDLCETKPPASQVLLSSFIVVSPQFPFYPDLKKPPKSRPWHWAHQIDTIEDILEEVSTKFHGNPKKIYATGFSRGGWGAIEIAKNLKKHKIAKLVLVDSESLPIAKLQIPTWIHYGGPRTSTKAANSYQALMRQANKDRWKTAAPGEKVPSSRYLRTDWNLNLGDDTTNHNATSRHAYSDSRIYDWLLAD